MMSLQRFPKKNSTIISNHQPIFNQNLTSEKIRFKRFFSAFRHDYFAMGLQLAPPDFQTF